MANSASCRYGALGSRSGRGYDRRAQAVRVSFLPVASPSVTLSPGHEDDEHTREVDMPRRGIAIAVVIIFASLIVLGLTSSFLVDWAWFSTVGYLGVFWTILGGKTVLFFAVFAGSA